MLRRRPRSRGRRDDPREVIQDLFIPPTGPPQLHASTLLCAPPTIVFKSHHVPHASALLHDHPPRRHARCACPCCCWIGPLRFAARSASDQSGRRRSSLSHHLLRSSRRTATCNRPCCQAHLCCTRESTRRSMKGRRPWQRWVAGRWRGRALRSQPAIVLSDGRPRRIEAPRPSPIASQWLAAEATPASVEPSAMARAVACAWCDDTSLAKRERKQETKR